MLGTGMAMVGVFAAWSLADRVAPTRWSGALALSARIASGAALALLIAGRFAPNLIAP